MLIASYTLKIRAEGKRLPNLELWIWEDMCKELAGFVNPALDKFSVWFEKRIPGTKAIWQTVERRIEPPREWRWLADAIMSGELDEEGMAELARDLLEKREE